MDHEPRGGLAPDPSPAELRAWANLDLHVEPEQLAQDSARRRALLDGALDRDLATHESGIADGRYLDAWAEGEETSMVELLATLHREHGHSYGVDVDDPDAVGRVSTALGDAAYAVEYHRF